jgi:hypothetical protein
MDVAKYNALNAYLSDIVKLVNNLISKTYIFNL